MGAINGIAINTAHELSHKHDRIDHILSHLALVPTGYNHFRIEHPYGITVRQRLKTCFFTYG